MPYRRFVTEGDSSAVVATRDIRIDMRGHRLETDRDLAVQIRVFCAFTSSLFRLGRVAFLFIVELPYELKEQMLKLGQAPAAAISQALKIFFEGAEPFLHRRAVFDE